MGIPSLEIADPQAPVRSPPIRSPRDPLLFEREKPVRLAPAASDAWAGPPNGGPGQCTGKSAKS
eukprot:373502-Alexandrium_andersonii.AAC.1